MSNVKPKLLVVTGKDGKIYRSRSLSSRASGDAKKIRALPWVKSVVVKDIK